MASSVNESSDAAMFCEMVTSRILAKGAKAAKAPKAMAKATGVPSTISTSPTILSTMALPLSP